ncbi:MAG TPA: exodeoxyribonuclease VII small subunit [Bacilli bacterium]|jgi:exodeoxyribonuclease VII small subunit|nr:exodeoxyribonuclease VII small subunit [Bacilli bacterium]HPA98856.1 exodeoxyribonuclease VII small subunit [Bacilli bacterium]HPV55242.1 exodeoxyribonuclease VII small subunit [Bacilli bacterium]HPX82911.1 exodeoxyribonuclease VII small subunit [Bacilli bacterium]HQB79682.1 exodeoxyribonuclease VII small subunit [Bacilli bacterium]
MAVKFEELLKELEKIVLELEKGDLSLEESLKKYQRGIELSKLCKEKLEEAKEVVVKNMGE